MPDRVQSLRLQSTILEVIAKGGSRRAIGDAVCGELERVLPNAICSVIRVDRAGMLRPLAAPSFPKAFCMAVDGLLAGPLVGSCGSAAYLREPVLVDDIATDPRWAKFRHIELPADIRACWSKPIVDEAGAVIAVIGLYFRERRGPTEREAEAVAACCVMLALALKWHERAVESERRANIDALTGLPGRAAFGDALAGVPCDQPGLWAVFVIDLDNLKVVNDTFGHSAGDALLKVAARRIANLMQPDRLFRLGGDEFALIIQSATALADLDLTARSILEELNRPAHCDGHAVVPQATIGGAVPGPGDDDPVVVQQNADFALYHAKETGRGGFVRHWPGIDAGIIRRRDAVRALSDALRDGRIEAHYQPVICLDTREIVGVEALCRMYLPDGEIMPAAQFQEATSDVRIGSDLTGRMLSIVAGDLRRWHDEGLPIRHVGVNVAMADFRAGRLAQQIEASFGRLGLDADHLILEVSERLYMNQKDDAVARAVKSLRQTGLTLALDDFGSGPASLTQLMTSPMRVLKLDRGLITQLAPGGRAAALVEGVIQIAGRLGLRVVAEGIESEGEAAGLLAMGCRLGQGHLFSPAVSRRAISALLRRHARGVADAHPLAIVPPVPVRDIGVLVPLGDASPIELRATGTG